MPVVGLPTAPVPLTVTPRSVGRLDVEGIVLGAGGDQELQVGQGLDDPARKRRALAHADHDGKALQGLDRLGLAGEGLVEDLDLDVLG